MTNKHKHEQCKLNWSHYFSRENIIEKEKGNVKLWIYFIFQSSEVANRNYAHFGLLPLEAHCISSNNRCNRERRCQKGENLYSVLCDTYILTQSFFFYLQLIYGADGTLIRGESRRGRGKGRGGGVSTVSITGYIFSYL